MHLPTRLYFALALSLLPLLPACSGKKRPGPPPIPSYISEEYFSSKYAEEIRNVVQSLAAGAAPYAEGSPTQPHDDLLAVLPKGTNMAPPRPGTAATIDLLGRHTVQPGGNYSLRNGMGILEMTVDGLKETSLVKQVQVSGTNYWICFRDTH